MSTRVYCKNILLIVSVLFLLPLVSCQVGLGSAVDTESPTIDITYPPASAVIKGTFTLAGTCSDDQGVSSITVTVTNTEDKTEVWSYESAAASGGKSWSVSLNRTDTAAATGFLFPDGKYEASVIAKDSSGHSSGTASRAFEIDNSAPVCILTSPASTDTASPTAYGANFKITGTIADDHTIKTMAVSVYDKNGNAIGGTDTTPFTESNVETAGGTVVYIAKYINGGTSELNTRYSTIYEAGDTSSDTRAYTCSITLTDAAKEYTDPSVSDDKDTTTGNATSVFYLSDAVKSTLDADGLEASDVKKILNGTYSGTADTATQTAVKALFQNNEHTKAAFSLNPDASPKYSVTGYSFTGSSDIGDNSATAKQKIQITATAGRDGTYVNPSTIIVYQFGPFDTAASLTTAVLSTIYTDPASYAESNPSISHILQNESGYYDNTAYSSGSVESYSYPVRLYSTIETKKYFVLAVTGQDVNGADMAPQDGACYGFVGSASGNPPTVSWDSYSSGVSVTKNIADLGFINTSAISFSGSAASKSSTIKSVAYTVTVTDESSSGSGTEIETYSGTAASGDGTFDGESETWSFNIADASGYTAYTAGSSIAYLYTIDLTVMDENGNTTTSERRIHVDTIDPSVNITSVSPTVTRSTDSKKCVNGTVTIGASISDTNFQSSSYSVYVGGSTVSGLTDVDITNKGYSPSITIDTTQLTDGSAFNVVLTVKDKAGNEASGSTTLYNSNTSYVIDQSTDKPGISLSNADTSLTSADKIKAAYTGSESKTNIFGTSSNNKLLGTVTDDDGIASISIAYDTASDGQYANTIYKNETVGGTTSFTIPDASFSKLAEGLYYLKITVADTKQATSYATYTTDYFAVAVDNGGPSFSSVTPANDGYYSASKPLSVAGTITDSSGIVTISMNSGNGTGSPQAVLKSGSTTAYTLSDTVTPPNTDGSYTIVYTAADRYGQTSSYEINYMVDTTAPSVLLPATSSNFTKTTTKSIEVYVSDQCATDGTPYSSSVASGIATVAYSINSGSGNSGTLNYYSKYTGSTNDTINKYYFIYKGTIILTDGVENVITYTVTDNAGNSYTSTDPSTYTVDATAPVITIDGGTSSISTTSTSTGNISFTVAATDNKSIDSLTISGITNSTGSVTKDTDYTISETDSLPGSITKVIKILGTSAKHDGTWSFTLNAEDSAGWSAESKTISVQVDTVRPGFYLDSTWNSAQSTAIVYKKANTETVSGYITNDTTTTGTGVSAVYARIIKAAADTDTGARTFSTGTASDWTNESSSLSVKNGTTYFDIPVDLSDSTYTGDQQYNVYLAAIDGAGNVSTAISAVMITPDATAPVVTIADTHSSEYFKAGASIALSGTVTEKYLSTFKLYASNGSTTTDISTSITTMPSSGTLQTWTATYTVPAGTADGTWSFYATATDKAGQAGSSSSVTTTIDTTVPVVTITSISPTVDSTYVNGIVTIKYTVTDTNFNSSNVSYKVYSAGTTAAKVTSSLSSASGTFTIDTKNLTDLKAMTVTVTAVDKAENSGSGSNSAYTVDESTDTPQVTFSNTTETIKNVLSTDVTGLLYSSNKASLKNIFGSTTNNKILGTVTDDDGLASVAVWSKPYSTGNEAETPGTTNGWTECTLTSTLSSGSTSYTLSAKVPVDEGQYSIKVVSTDTKGETSVSSGTKTFAIAVDNGAPSFTITTSSGQYFKQNSTQDVTFSISDGSGSVTVTGSNYPTGVSGAISGSAKDTLTLGASADDGTITYTATDLYGQSSTATFTYIIDTTAPTLTVASGIVTELNTGKIYETSGYYSASTGKYTYSGSWSDTQSGTSVIEYSTDGGATWNVFDAATSKTGTGTTWSVSLELTEGENQQIAFRADDAAGNWTTPASGSTSFTGLTVDLSKPTVTFGTIGTTTYNSSDDGSSFTVTGYVTDSNKIGAASAVTPAAYLNGTAVTLTHTAGSTTWTNSTYGLTITSTAASTLQLTVTYTMTIPSGAADGIWTFGLTGKDAAGRDAAAVVKTSDTAINKPITIDTVAPSLTVTNAASDETNLITKKKIFETNSNYKKIDTQAYYVLSGTWSDTTTGTSTLYYTTASNPSSVTETGTDSADAGSKWISVSGLSQTTAQTNWTINVPVAEGNSEVIAVKAVDEAGNETALTESTTRFSGLTFDFSVPEISTITLAGGTLNTDSNVYYVKNTGSSQTLSGTAAITDTLSMGAANDFADFVKPTVTLKGTSVSFGTVSYTGGGTTATYTSTLMDGTTPYATITESLSGTTVTVTFSVTVGTTHKQDGAWIFNIAGTDAAGRSAVSATASATVDTVAPEPIAYNAAGYIFQVNDKDWSDSTWYKTTTMRIKGYFTENTSGLDKVYYYVQTPTGSAPGTGSIVSDSNYISLTGSTGGYIPYTFTIAGFEADSSTNTNIMYIQAEDKAGNISTLSDSQYTIHIDQDAPSIEADSAYTDAILTNGQSDIPVTGTTADAASGIAAATMYVGNSTSYSILYDASSAVANTSYVLTTDTSFAADKTYYTDTSGTISGDTTGSPATKGLYVKQTSYTSTGSYGAITLVQSGDYSVNNSKWTLSINADSGSGWFSESNLGTNPGVYAVITDNAGNASSKTKLCSLQIDTVPPKAEISTPLATSSGLNGKQTITGTVTEANTPTSIALYYYSGSSIPASLSGWTRYQTITTQESPSSPDASTTYGVSVSSIYNWSIANFDFASFAGTDGKATVYILPVAYDKAGNCSANDGSIAAYSSSSGYTGYTTYTVDQDTDRPTINFTNLTLASMTAANPIWLKNANVIYGTITDDDGITSLAYNTDGGSTWTDIPVSNGSWNLKLDDGEKTIYFQVVDKAETTFISSSSANMKSPKLSDGSTSSTTYTILHLNVDKTPPVYSNIKYKVYDTDTSTWSSDWLSDYSDEKFGGKHSKFRIQLQATDDNGIASVTASLGIAPTVYTGAKDSSDTSGKTWVIDNILVDSTYVKDGSNTVTITVTDGAELTSTATMQIAVDNTSPAITVLGPSSATSSSGNITVYGSIDGSATVYYAVSPSGTVSPDSDSASTTFTYDTAGSSGNAITEKSAAIISAATAYTQITDASLSWYIYFDAGSGDTKTHSETLNTWLDTLGITTAAAIAANTYTDITKLYVWIKSIDSYGNKTETAHLILLDPQGDRPTVDIDYPETDGTALGGTVKLYGSADDNSAVKNVFVQIMSEQHSVSAYEANGTSFGTFAYNSSSYATETFTPSADDLDYLAMAGYKIYKMSNTVTSASTGYWVAGTSTLASGESASDYGILATLNGSSWSLKINTNGELNPSGDTSNIVAVRVYAYDDGNTQSLATDRTMKFDKNNPVFGSISLVQSEGVSNAYKYNADTTAEQECTSGMYVRGTWYIKGSVTDDNGISDLIISDNSTDNSLVSGEAGSGAGTAISSTKWEAVQSADGKTCYFKYTLDTSSGVGKHVITVTAKDGTTTQYSSAYSATVNYDNTAPVLASSTDSSYDISPSISQSDSFYTMSSTVTEASVSGVSQSGFKRLAFYFVRRYGSTYAYDPMLVKSSSSNKIDLISGTNDSSIIYNSGLFWKVKTVTWSSDSANVVTLSASDDNIHAGGLLKANGIIYTIKSVSDETITLDGNLTKSPGTVYAALALVVDNTVSEGYSTSASLESDGYYSSANLTNDDGDRMIEYVSNTGTVWTWQANVCSKNIPDGPIEIHYTAFDAAGNYSTGVVGHVNTSDYSAYKNTAAYDTADVDAYAADSSAVSVYAYDNSNPAFVSNNRPRIAGVTIGTDYDNNGTIDSDEEESSYSAANYSADSVTGTTTGGKKIYDPTAKSLTKYKITALPTDLTLGTNTSPLMTLKGYSEIIPEIVGGNGAIYYQYSCGLLSGKNSTTALVTDGSTDYTVDTSETLKLQLGDLIQAGDTDNTPFVFTFWDSTDGAGTFASTTDGRQYAKLTLYLGVSVQAVGTPEAKIIPFYWNSSSDNSLYGNSTVNGHVELEKDWAESSGYSSSATTGEYDADPKVSGKIVIRGTAHDDTRINKLYVSVPGMETAFGTSAGITDTVTVNSVKYYCLATYNSSSGKLVPVDGSSYGFTLSISKDTISSSGHDVNWALSWDTSTISTVAATDVKVQILAYNQGKPSCSTGSTYSALGHLSIDGTTYYSDPSYTGETANTPDTTQTKNASDSSTSDYTSLYKMDVVPYIRGVKTSLSTLKKTTSSVYDRTALGHYPVKSNLSAYFYGFNLASNATVSDSASTANTTTLGSADTSSYSGYTVYPAAVSSLTSGTVSVTVSTVTSLNNKNLNDAKGSYTETTSSDTGDYSVYSNYYNRQPNNENNNNLTDDVVLDVWTVKNSARSHSGTLTEPVMRIVPAADTDTSNNDVMRFAFTNGAEYFSMAPAYSTQNSYQYWEKNYADFNNVAFTYDSEGNSYGITTGLDTYPDGTNTLAGRLTFISSRWGVCSTTDMNDNYYGNHKLRLEAIGIMKGAYVQGSQLTDDYIMDTRRFSSPVLTTAVHGSGTGTSASTSVYLAYYDKFQKQIRFRYGTLSSSTSTPTTNSASNNSTSCNFGQFLDQHAQADVRNSSSSYYVNNKYAFDAAFEDYSLIAGKDAKTSNDTGNAAGKYVAIDVVPGSSTATDVVVAVWYDGSDLKYSYKLNPYTDNDADQSHAGTSGYWSPATTIFTDGGKYCAIKVDPNGGIHIAAQDSNDQDLKYAYLSKYDTSYSESANAVTVDSYGIVGTQVQIDTEIESGKVIPYISYYNGATEKPKMAYLVPQTTMDYAATGSDSTTEIFTGKWEVTIVPTSSEVQDDHTNIGLWKTTSGTKRTKVKGGSSYDSIDVTTGYSFGNGTVNPVVGYATVDGTQGYIETAQKQ
jgi:large repetitive protein